MERKRRALRLYYSTRKLRQLHDGRGEVIRTLTKGHFIASLGLAAITGAGFSFAFTVLNDASAWLAIPFFAIALGVSPLLAGWLSPGLRHVALFPISVLGCLLIASAIYGPLSSDSEPIGFAIILTVIYGGGASLAFCVGWITRQWLGRLRGRRMNASLLTIASLVAVCCSVALSALFLAVPLASMTTPRAPYWSAILAPIGLIGVAAGAAVIWSDRHKGRWSLVGLALALLYLGASVAPPVFLTTAHWYGPVALVLVTLATWNISKWKRGAGHWRLFPSPQPRHSSVERNVRGSPTGSKGRYEKFSKGALGVLTHAQEEAQVLRHSYIGTEHILLGLLRESDSVAANVLNNLGLELTTVRSKVEFIIGLGDRPTLGEIHLANRAKRIIELAVGESRQSDHHNIDTQHLLIGLLREGEGVAAGFLKSMGVNEERIRGEVARLSQNSE